MKIKSDDYYLEFPEKVSFNKAKVPDAPSWFFILTTGRTGSTVLTRLLSLHPDIHCANEQNVLPLFSILLNSKIYFKEKPRFRYSHENQQEVNLLGLRSLIETWKSIQTSKRCFGDKDLSYGGDFSKLIDLVLPGNRKILSTRNVLDQLSSLYHQKWYTKLPKNKSERFDYIRNDVTEKNSYVKKWKNKCDLVISFESFYTSNEAKQTIYKIIEMLGLNNKNYPIRKAVGMCRHSTSSGRWKEDELILSFLKKLKVEDSKLYEKLITNSF